MAEGALKDIGPVVLVGAGKMGLALAQGWIAAGISPDDLVLVDPTPPEAAKRFAETHKVRLIATPQGVLTAVLVLAVKPQIADQVMAEVKPSVGRHTLAISIAAGISLARLSAGFGTERIVRTMPNTPAQIGKGVTGAVGMAISEKDVATTEALLRAGGDVVWFDEEAMIDAVTAVSGSGPAYVFHFVEALAAAAMKQGLGADEAIRLARQTVIGAAALMEHDRQPVSVLRENVTSPKGTTYAALQVLMAEEGGLKDLVDRAVTAARLRSEELGRG
jgi:pyrroline-5-carboxylate reductase